MDGPSYAHAEPGFLADFSHERCFKTLAPFESAPRKVPKAGVEGQVIPASKEENSIVAEDYSLDSDSKLRSSRHCRRRVASPFGPEGQLFATSVGPARGQGTA